MRRAGRARFGPRGARSPVDDIRGPLFGAWRWKPNARRRSPEAVKGRERAFKAGAEETAPRNERSCLDGLGQGSAGLREVAADASHMSAGLSALGRVQPPDFHIEREAQLSGFLVRQPVRHLRKDGAPGERAARVPRKAPRRAHLGEHDEQFGPHFVRIGAIHGRSPLDARQLRLAFAEQVQLIVVRHGGRVFSSRGGSAFEFARGRGLWRRLVAGCPRLLVNIADGHDRPRHDPVEQIGLPRFERNQPAEDVEEQERLGASVLSTRSSDKSREASVQRGIGCLALPDS